MTTTIGRLPICEGTGEGAFTRKNEMLCFMPFVLLATAEASLAFDHETVVAMRVLGRKIEARPREQADLAETDDLTSSANAMRKSVDGFPADERNGDVLRPGITIAHWLQSDGPDTTSRHYTAGVIDTVHYHILDFDALSPSARAEHPSLETPSRSWSKALLPTVALNDGLQDALREKCAVDTRKCSNSGRGCDHGANNALQPRDHLVDQFRSPVAKIALLVLIRRVVAVLMVVMSGFLTVLFLMIGDQIADRKGRRIGMVIVLAALFYLLLSSIGTMVLVNVVIATLS